MTTHRGGSEKARKRRAVIRRDGERCVYCGATDDLTLDHIVPRSRGGTDAIANLQLLCRSCNHLKGNRLEPGDVTPARVKRRRAPKALVRSRLAERLHRGSNGRMVLHDSRCDATFCMDTCPVRLERDAA